MSPPAVPVTATGANVRRSGRDMPGSNWHVYLLDPEANQNELCFGMEQIGCMGFSKPKPMHSRKFGKVAELPQIAEEVEVRDAEKAGIGLQSGFRDRETAPLKYDVGGVLLARCDIREGIRQAGNPMPSVV